MADCKWCGNPLPHNRQRECESCWDAIQSLSHMSAELIEKVLRGLGFQARVMRG